MGDNATAPVLRLDAELTGACAASRPDDLT